MKETNPLASRHLYSGLTGYKIMIKTHHFQVDDAVLYGVEKAVLLNNLKYWLDHAKANGKKAIDGYYWTFNSATAFAELIPYIDSRKIGRLMRELEADGIIIVGNHNRAGYDRTKWYTMPDYALQDAPPVIVQNVTLHCHNLDNPLSQFGQPIPDINTDNKHNSKQVKKSPKKNSHLIPVDWIPNDKHIESCINQGLMVDDISEHFRDHHTAKGSKMSDWDAAFRTWIRNAVKFNKPSTGQQVAINNNQSFDDALKRVF
jgi:hypothetical protein